jgi:SAM-dependent methyltransferase
MDDDDDDNPFPFQDEDFIGNPLNLAESPPSTISAVFTLFEKHRKINLGCGDSKYIDLGCGDGRYVFAAVKRGIFSVGIDLEPSNIRKCQAEKERLGLADSECMFYEADIFDFDISSFTLISVYLLESFLNEIACKIMKRLTEDGSRDVLFATVLYKPKKWAPGIDADDLYRIYLYDKTSSLLIKE